MNKQAGMSLSEVLIGLFLSSLIMMTLTQFYLSSKKQYLAAQDILSKNFDVQWVSDLLSDSIRRAGFTPCLSIDQLINDDKLQSIRVQNNPQQSIQIQRMDEHFFKVKRLHGATKIVVERSVFHEKNPILIADCEHAEVHQILSVSSQADGTVLTLKKPLRFPYSSSVYVGEFVEERWFIKKNAGGEEALYYQANQAEEMTPLIHSMNSSIREKQLVKIVMELDMGKKQELWVRVRGT